jgi:hypothetical protein
MCTLACKTLYDLLLSVYIMQRVGINIVVHISNNKIFQKENIFVKSDSKM